MPSVETHYSRPGIFETILSKLHEQGIQNPTRKDIAGVDEFHVRGAEVSLELAHETGLNTGTRVLDIGCGIGGPCRMLAEKFGCHATGVDITEEYIRTAGLLSELVGLSAHTKFLHADALELPFANASFDVAWTQHVQMNIEDKKRFYTEISRVLIKGGRFIYYDIFKKGKEPIYYPVPWADDPSISFLTTTAALHELLSGLGFSRVQTKDQTEAGIQFFSRMQDKISKGEGPLIGLHLLIGNSAKEKLANVSRNLAEGRIELQSGIYLKE